MRPNLIIFPKKEKFAVSISKAYLVSKVLLTLYALFFQFKLVDTFYVINEKFEFKLAEELNYSKMIWHF